MVARSLGHPGVLRRLVPGAGVPSLLMRLVAPAIAVVLALAGIVLLPFATQPAQAAGITATGCSLGTAGAGAGTKSNVCWINLSGWTFTPGTWRTGTAINIGNYRLTYQYRVTSPENDLAAVNTPADTNRPLGSGLLSRYRDDCLL